MKLKTFYILFYRHRIQKASLIRKYFLWFLLPFKYWINFFYFKKKINLDKYSKDNKFLFGWSCKLWNKEADLDTFIETIKEEHKCISIYEAYLEYTKYSSNDLTVSKRYFEKYIEENCHEYIDDEDDLKF